MQENTVFATIEVMEAATGNDNQVTCTGCGNRYDIDDVQEIYSGLYCDDCVDELFTECNGCGEMIHNDDAIEAQGSYYCDACHLETFDTCEGCGETVRLDESHNVDGDHYCEDCFYESFSYCERCGDPVANDDAIMYRDSIYCDCCISEVAERCDDCGKWVSETVSTAEGRNICEGCYSEGYFTCEECGEVRNYELHYDHDHDGYCVYCRSTHATAIMSYGTTPDLCFHHVNNEERLAFMGVELEIDEGGENNKKAEAIRDCFEDNQVYFNHDGSLTNGFEIISHPFTLEYYRETLSENYADAMAKAVKMGYRSHDTTTCGLHVHVSRLAFGDDAEVQDATLGKLWYITKKFWPELVRFSRRKAEHLNRWAAPLDDVADEVAEHDDAATIGKKVKEKGENGRYRAINTLNRATIEFRLFRGTLNHRTFTATIELVHALVTMARRMSFEGLKEIDTFRDLIEAAHSGNVGGYKALYEYAYEKKFFAVA